MVASSSSSSEGTRLKVELLEASFEKIKPQANEFATSFYDNLFTDYPDAKPLFQETDISEQSKKLLASLVFVVENLKKPGALTDALKGLGARHVQYGALPEHYPLVGNTLLKTFGQFLNEDWTHETKEAWVEAYGVITEVMLDGADYAPNAVELDSQVSEDAGLQVELLTSSFAKIVPNADRFAASFYDNLFTDYPAAKPLFKETDIKAQSKKLTASLVFVIENLKKPDALSDALKGLGARHVKYGALPEHYPLVGNTLLKTFEQYLGADWTPQTKTAWVDAYGVISEVMLEGADYEPDSIQLSSPPKEATSKEPVSVSPVDAGGPNPVPVIAGLASVMSVLALIFILL